MGSQDMLQHFISVCKSVQFDGRASRAEYWSFVLISLLVVISCGILSTFESIRPVGMFMMIVFLLGTAIQHIAVQVRRLHDSDKSGWWYLISFVPYLGGLVMLVFMVLDGTKGPNNYGEDPYNRSTQSTIDATEGWQKIS